MNSRTQSNSAGRNENRSTTQPMLLTGHFCCVMGREFEPWKAYAEGFSSPSPSLFPVSAVHTVPVSAVSTAGSTLCGQSSADRIWKIRWCSAFTSSPCRARKHDAASWPAFPAYYLIMDDHQVLLLSILYWLVRWLLRLSAVPVRRDLRRMSSCWRYGMRTPCCAGLSSSFQHCATPPRARVTRPAQAESGPHK